MHEHCTNLTHTHRYTPQRSVLKAYNINAFTHTRSELKKASLKGLRQHGLLGHPKRLSSPSASETERAGDGRESETTFPKRKQTKEEEKKTFRPCIRSRKKLLTLPESGKL